MSQFSCKKFDVKQHEKVFKITTDATLLGALCVQYHSDKPLQNILEIGSGTGIISLMLAQRFPEASILALDNNPHAAELSKYNFNQSNFSDRLDAKCMDFLKYENHGLKFDLIISNPPYFVNDTPAESDMARTARHQGLLSYSNMIEKSMQLLHETGIFSMICPYRYEDMIDQSIQNAYPTHKIYFAHQKGAPIRNMMTEIYKESSNKASTKENFYLKDSDGQYTDSYRQCLKDFLTIF